MTEEAGLGNPGAWINYKYLFLKFTKDAHVIKVNIGRNEREKEEKGKDKFQFSTSLLSTNPLTTHSRFMTMIMVLPLT